MDDLVTKTATPLKQFAKESRQFWNRSSKPDAKGILLVTLFIKDLFNLEFNKIALATGAGFLVLGFVGYFIRLIFIPINHVLVGGKA